MPKYLIEFIGTFFLVLTISLTVITEQPLAPLAIGAVLMAVIYMGGHISMAHYNPAVTLAAVIRGSLPLSDAAPYVGAQLAASILASIIGNFIAGGSIGLAHNAERGIVPALLIEILFTFLLVLVIFNVATTKNNAGNGFYGLAIAAAVVGGAIAGGGISGAAYNPAVGIGIWVGDLIAGTATSSIWLYIVGPSIGGVLAAGAFRLQDND